MFVLMNIKAPLSLNLLGYDLVRRFVFQNSKKWPDIVAGFNVGTTLNIAVGARECHHSC